jgi:hypothetical protein
MNNLKENNKPIIDSLLDDENIDSNCKFVLIDKQSLKTTKNKISNNNNNNSSIIIQNNYTSINFLRSSVNQESINHLNNKENKFHSLNSNNQTASTKNLNGNFFLTYYVFFSENF